MTKKINIEVKKIIEISSYEIRTLIKKYLSNMGYRVEVVKYSKCGAVVYLKENNDDIAIVYKEEESRKIIELKPVQIKMILEDPLQKYKIRMRSIQFKEEGAIIFIEDVGKIFMHNAINDYDEKFEDIGCDVRIANCLNSSGNNSIGQLEDFFKSKISENRDLKLTPKMVFMGLSEGLGEKSFNSFVDFLKLKNLEIRGDGAIVPIS